MTIQIVAGWAETWEALAASPLSLALREATWAYPALETIHLIGIALLVGPILVFDMAILGRRQGLHLEAVGRLLLPVVFTGFALNIVTGTLLFASDPAEFAASPAFATKLGLIVVAVGNGAFFQWRHSAVVAAGGPIGGAGRAHAVVSILLWLAVIAAGRLIAYTG